MGKVLYKLQWNDGQGGVFTKTFHSWEEREAFRARVEQRDWRGLSNVTVWESKGAEMTVPEGE